MIIMVITKMGLCNCKFCRYEKDLYQYDPLYILNSMTQNSKIVIHRLINVKNNILSMNKGVNKCV